MKEILNDTEEISKNGNENENDSKEYQSKYLSLLLDSNNLDLINKKLIKMKKNLSK